MKYSDLNGKPVISVATAEKIGDVDDVYINTREQRILAVRVNMSGLFSGHRSVLWSDIQSVGENAVTIPNAEVLHEEKDLPVLQDAVQSGDILGNRIVTEGGTDVGTAGDFDFDSKTGEIASYVLSGGILQSLQRQEHLVPATWVKSIGSKLIVVRNEVTSTTT